MNNKDEILKEIQDIMSKTFKLPKDDITLEKNLGTDLDLDSLDAIDLVVEMSKRIDHKFNEDDLRSIKTVGDIVDAIAVKLNIN